MTSTTEVLTETRTTRSPKLRESDKAMFRARLRNRLFDELRALFRRRRQEAGLKQKDIATRLDTDPGTVSRRLKGEENVTLDWVSDFARALDARVEVRIVPLEDVGGAPTPKVVDWSRDQAFHANKTRRAKRQVFDLSRDKTIVAKSPETVKT
jgi:transcriptional regulator with XRE-family HTH domain